MGCGKAHFVRRDQKAHLELKILVSNFVLWHLEATRMDIVKNLGNGWSKPIVLENKVFLNFDLRHGASIAKLWPNIFQYILRKVGLLWITTS